MMKQIALIGTSHKYQKEDKDCSKQDAQAFKDFLEKACCDYNIRTVAEEMNEEALVEVDRNESIPQRVAGELSLTPLFCDPDRKQRRDRGLLQENDIRIQQFSDPNISDDEIEEQIRAAWMGRELYWLERLQTVPESEWPVLFICGAHHVTSFSRILEEKGFIVTRIEDDWEP